MLQQARKDSCPKAAACLAQATCPLSHLVWLSPHRGLENLICSSAGIVCREAAGTTCHLAFRTPQGREAPLEQ